MIEGLQDSNKNQIVKYTYDQYGLLSGVFSYENGEWVENNFSDFIGNKNKMLSVGMYYDKNTECYYINQRYYNPVLNKYMDGTTNDDLFSNVNPCLQNNNSNTMPLASDDSDWAALQWSEQLLGSSSYGLPISYSSSWYSSLSDVEVVARAIYCEGGTTYTDEDSAVAWVILNRINNSRFPNTSASVVKASGQFSSITGGSGSTQDARVPSTNTSRWEHSTYLACLLLTTTSETEWRTIIGDKLDGQLYFYAYTVAKNKYDNKNSIFTGTTDDTLKYNGTLITDVYVQGYGNVTSFESLFDNYNPTVYSRNIFYNLK